MRLPGILADLLSIRLLKHHKPAAMWSLALSPVAILISGYHCNTDSIYAAFSLLAALQLDQRLFFRGGLALAAAVNVKLIPALLIIPAFSLCTRPREAKQLLGGLAVGIITPGLVCNI